MVLRSNENYKFKWGRRTQGTITYSIIRTCLSRIFPKVHKCYTCNSDNAYYSSVVVEQIDTTHAHAKGCQLLTSLKLHRFVSRSHKPSPLFFITPITRNLHVHNSMSCHRTTFVSTLHVSTEHLLTRYSTNSTYDFTMVNSSNRQKTKILQNYGMTIKLFTKILLPDFRVHHSITTLMIQPSPRLHMFQKIENNKLSALLVTISK